MKPRIPNLNTLSTLFDRLSIENVKLAHFENALEHDQLTDTDRGEYHKKISVQSEIIESLKEEVVNLFEEVLSSKEYAYIKEERTFK